MLSESRHFPAEDTAVSVDRLTESIRATGAASLLFSMPSNDPSQDLVTVQSADQRLRKSLTSIGATRCSRLCRLVACRWRRAYGTVEKQATDLGAGEGLPALRPLSCEVTLKRSDF